MARNLFRIFTENKPVRGLWKKYNIPEVNWLKFDDLFVLYWYGNETKDSSKAFIALLL